MAKPTVKDRFKWLVARLPVPVRRHLQALLVLVQQRISAPVTTLKNKLPDDKAGLLSLAQDIGGSAKFLAAQARHAPLIAAAALYARAYPLSILAVGLHAYRLHAAAGTPLLGLKVTVGVLAVLGVTLTFPVLLFLGAAALIATVVLALIARPKELAAMINTGEPVLRSLHEIVQRAVRAARRQPRQDS